MSAPGDQLITSMDLPPNPDHIRLLVGAGSLLQGQAVEFAKAAYELGVTNKWIAMTGLNYHEQVQNGDLTRVNQVIPTFVNNRTLQGYPHGLMGNAKLGQDLKPLWGKDVPWAFDRVDDRIAQLRANCGQCICLFGLGGHYELSIAMAEEAKRRYPRAQFIGILVATQDQFLLSNLDLDPEFPDNLAKKLNMPIIVMMDAPQHRAVVAKFLALLDSADQLKGSPQRSSIELMARLGSQAHFLKAYHYSTDMGALRINILQKAMLMVQQQPLTVVDKKTLPLFIGRCLAGVHAEGADCLGYGGYNPRNTHVTASGVVAADLKAMRWIPEATQTRNEALLHTQLALGVRTPNDLEHNLVLAPTYTAADFRKLLRIEAVHLEALTGQDIRPFLDALRAQAPDAEGTVDHKEGNDLDLARPMPGGVPANNGTRTKGG